MLKNVSLSIMESYLQGKIKPSENQITSQTQLPTFISKLYTCFLMCRFPTSNKSSRLEGCNKVLDSIPLPIIQNNSSRKKHNLKNKNQMSNHMHSIILSRKLLVN